MTTANIGHNGGPDLDGRKLTVRTLWAKALFADPSTPTHVMAIAWAIHWYSRADGTGAALSNQQLKVICGISEPTATRGKRWLRDNGYVQLKVGTGDTKTEFQMCIPEARAEAADADGVITQTTQPLTTQGEMTQGHQADHPRVITGLVYNQERDSGPIPDNSGGEVAWSKKPAPVGKTNYWQSQLNPPHSDYEFADGKLRLVNGTRSRWLIEFGDDATRLDLAIDEAAAQVQPNSPKPIEVQVTAALARIASRRRDQAANYERAVAANKAAGSSGKVSSDRAAIRRRLENT